MGDLPRKASASSAVDEAFRALKDKLRGFIRKRVHSDETVEDLLQEVFTKAVVASNSGREPANLAGWLYATARTTIVDHYRSSRTRTEVDETLVARPDDPDLGQELSTSLRPLASTLAPIYRETLFATDFEGRSLQSVADLHGLSLSAVKSRASRARALLRAQLLECCRIETTGRGIADYAPRVTGGPACASGAADSTSTSCALEMPSRGGCGGGNLPRDHRAPPPVSLPDLVL